MRYYNQHWTPENGSQTQPRAIWNGSNNRKVSTRFLEDGSYMRLKNVQIGYTVPNTDRIKISSLRWETSHQINAGIDVEVLKGSLGGSVDYWGNYPVAKSVTFGLNLTF